MSTGGMPSAGLSPRLRGNLARFNAGDVRDGSIPALAGEPMPCAILTENSTVYPRACGGTGYIIETKDNGVGLSPRLRGNHEFSIFGLLYHGSIPALAGEPRRGCRTHHRCWVYPRACGGTAEGGGYRPGIEGLSPRLRGNLLESFRRSHLLRSIPALAGEPKTATTST